MFNLIIAIFLFISYHVNAKDKSELIFHENPKKIENLVFFDLDDNKEMIPKNAKLKIVNFWAIWCSPCIKEIPDLLKLKKKFNKKTDLYFISVGYSTKDEINNFVEENNFNQMNILKDKEMQGSKSLNIKVMPTTLILDQNNNEILRVNGYVDWSSDKMIDIFDRL